MSVRKPSDGTWEDVAAHRVSKITLAAYRVAFKGRDNRLYVREYISYKGFKSILPAGRPAASTAGLDRNYVMHC